MMTTRSCSIEIGDEAPTDGLGLRPMPHLALKPSATSPAAWRRELSNVIKAEREEASVNRVSANRCARCEANIIAPQWSEHVSDYCVRNVWSCEACGYQFEDTVYLSAREAADAD